MKYRINWNVTLGVALIVLETIRLFTQTFDWDNLTIMVLAIVIMIEGIKEWLR